MPDRDPISPPAAADPTPLTTAALLREVAHVRIELAGVDENIKTRLDAMDKAVELFKADLVRVPTDTDKQIQNLAEKIQVELECVKELIFERFKVLEEKFHGVATRFQLSDQALIAALAAAKELTGKAEIASAKQMDQVRDIVNTSIGGLNDKGDLLGNRTTTLESQVTGLLQTVAQLRVTAPAPPVMTPVSTTPIGLWIMAGFSVVILLIILAFEIAQRAPSGVVR